MTSTSDVVVVGAGVVGCSVAYYLARQGASVTLIERESIGSGSSAHATGSLSLLSTEFSAGLSFQFALAGYREFPDLGAALGGGYGHGPAVPAQAVSASSLGRRGRVANQGT